MGLTIATPADEVDVSGDTLGIDEMLASIELRMSDESVGGNDDDDAPDSVGGDDDEDDEDDDESNGPEKR